MPKYHQCSAELSHFNAARCRLILTSHKQFDDFFFISVFSFSRSSFQIVIFSLSHSLLFYDHQHRNASARPISPLMAVITPYFPSMSLIHLTVGFPLCCCPSILIKPELNDQQWLCAGAHPSQHVSERPPVVMWAHTYKPVLMGALLLIISSTWLDAAFCWRGEKILIICYEQKKKIDWKSSDWPLEWNMNITIVLK